MHTIICYFHTASRWKELHALRVHQCVYLKNRNWSSHQSFPCIPRCNKLICWKSLYNCVGLAEASSDMWLKSFEIPFMCASDHDSLFVSSSEFWFWLSLIGWRFGFALKIAAFWTTSGSVELERVDKLSNLNTDRLPVWKIDRLTN